MPASKVPAFTEGLDKVRLRTIPHLSKLQDPSIMSTDVNWSFGYILDEHFHGVVLQVLCESWCGAGSCF